MLMLEMANLDNKENYLQNMGRQTLDDVSK